MNVIISMYYSLNNVFEWVVQLVAKCNILNVHVNIKNANYCIILGTQKYLQKLLKRYQVNNLCLAAMHLPELVKKKRASLADAYLLAIFLGLFGAHYFYLRRRRWGYLYLFTVGLFGVGWLIDLFRLKSLVSRFNEDTSDQNLAKEKRLDDAYVLWFPFGILGRVFCIA